MFDFSMGDQLKDLNLVAAWFLGSGLVLLVIGIAWSGGRWAWGKALGLARHSEGGMTGVALCLVGALVLGSVGGAIQWTTAKGKTESLMPVAARQKTITIDRPAATTSCTAEVGVEYGKFMKYDNSPNWWSQKRDQLKPSDEDHKKLEGLLTQMGVWDWNAKFAYAKTLTWGWDGAKVDAGEWKKYSNLANDKNRQARLAKVTWVPDGKNQDCSENNIQPAKKTKLTVISWENNKGSFSGDDHGRYIAWEFDVPDNAKTKKG